jgi:prefoldin subunit 5
MSHGEISTMQHGRDDGGTAGTIQVLVTEIRHLTTAVGEIKQTVNSYPALLERQATTERRQMDTDQRLAEILEKMEKSIIRVHERMDDVRAQVQDDTQKVRIEFHEFTTSHRNEIANQMTTALEVLTQSVSSLDTKVTTVKAESESWINKGKGAWFAASVLMGIIQMVIVTSIGYVATELRSMHDWQLTADQTLKGLVAEKAKTADAPITAPRPPGR